MITLDKDNTFPILVSPYYTNHSEFLPEKKKKTTICRNSFARWKLEKKRFQVYDFAGWAPSCRRTQDSADELLVLVMDGAITQCQGWARKQGEVPILGQAPVDRARVKREVNIRVVKTWTSVHDV